MIVESFSRLAKIEIGISVVVVDDVLLLTLIYWTSQDVRCGNAALPTLQKRTSGRFRNGA